LYKLGREEKEDKRKEPIPYLGGCGSEERERERGSFFFLKIQIGNRRKQIKTNKFEQY
jgi:hypothetical protein